MSSPQNCRAVSGTPARNAAQMPTRTARRTKRGLRAPNAWEANGATAETRPIPSVKAANSMVWLRAAAATT